jgi:6-phosphogluconolactonase (cycloisomerase 2 family)
MRYWIVLLLACVSTLAAAPQTFLYVANGSAQSISAYTVNPASGALTAVSGSPFAVGANLNSLAVDPAGGFVYVVSADSVAVFGHAVNPAGGATNRRERISWPSVSKDAIAPLLYGRGSVKCHTEPRVSKR